MYLNVRNYYHFVYLVYAIADVRPDTLPLAPTAVFFVTLAHAICVVRVASAEVSKSLELCEDELKDLGAALEEITEAFEEAARRTQQQLDINNSGCVPSECPIASLHPLFSFTFLSSVFARCARERVGRRLLVWMHTVLVLEELDHFFPATTACAEDGCKPPAAKAKPYPFLSVPNSLRLAGLPAVSLS